MEIDLSVQHSLLDNVIFPLLNFSKSQTLNESLETLIETSRTPDGRSDLTKNKIFPVVLELAQALSNPPSFHLLLLSLRLLRNLCAGEIENQNSFIEKNGMVIISSILGSLSDLDYRIMRIGLQVLANVVLAGEEHQHAVWQRFFPYTFDQVAHVQRRETCDPLCMVIYICIDGDHGLARQLCGEEGLCIVSEIIHTTSMVGYGEDWLKLLLSRICLEGSYFSSIFSKLRPFISHESSEDIKAPDYHFVSSQAFLLSIISEILNERITEITVANDFALYVLRIFTKASRVLGSISNNNNSGLPTCCTLIDVLGYSLTLLRDICAQDHASNKVDADIVDLLMSEGLLESLLSLLRELEPPKIIKKAMRKSENDEENINSYSRKLCPYRGFRRDVLSVIGNCCYRRTNIQDEVRQKNGILLMLQQCVTDDNNPFLREWGIWTVRNLLEGNEENQRVVSELELQGSVDMPEISELGLRVEVNEKTRRPKLVNIS